LGNLCKTAERRRTLQGVILSEVSNAHEVDMASGFRTDSRKRTLYRFPVREALLSFAMLSSLLTQIDIAAYLYNKLDLRPIKFNSSKTVARFLTTRSGSNTVYPTAFARCAFGLQLKKVQLLNSRLPLSWAEEQES